MRGTTADSNDERRQRPTQAMPQPHSQPHPESQPHHGHQQEKQRQQQASSDPPDVTCTDQHNYKDVDADVENGAGVTPYHAYRDIPHNLIFRARLWSHPILYFLLVTVVVSCLLILLVERHHLWGSLVVTAVVAVLFAADFLSRPSYYEIIIVGPQDDADDAKSPANGDNGDDGEEKEEAGNATTTTTSKRDTYQCHVMVVPVMGHDFHRTFKDIVGVALEGPEKPQNEPQRVRQRRRVVLTKRVTDRLGRSFIIHPREPQEFVTALQAALDFSSSSSSSSSAAAAAPSSLQQQLEQEESPVTKIEGTILSKVVVLP